jgi:hypothetical protein
MSILLIVKTFHCLLSLVGTKERVIWERKMIVNHDSDMRSLWSTSHMIFHASSSPVMVRSEIASRFIHLRFAFSSHQCVQVQNCDSVLRGAASLFLRECEHFRGAPDTPFNHSGSCAPAWFHSRSDSFCHLWEWSTPVCSHCHRLLCFTRHSSPCSLLRTCLFFFDLVDCLAKSQCELETTRVVLETSQFPTTRLAAS